MRINIMGSSGSLYSEFITLPSDAEMLDASKNPDTGTGKVIITPDDLYRVVPATSTDPSISG